MTCTLVATHHDPDGRLHDQIARVLPALAGIFARVAIQATYASHPRSLELLASAGALVRHESQAQFNSVAQLGFARRATLELGLQEPAPTLLFCDFDRALHWAERYPAELASVVVRLAEHDFVVLGRSERAFATHPRVQRDTEAIINHVYASASGRAWDVTAAARGISRRAAAALLEGCPESSIGTDVAWPLFMQRAGGYSLGYIATEGLEFETADRFADQIAQAGGLEQWIARIDADPQQWADRLDLARLEVAAAVPYSEAI